MAQFATLNSWKEIADYLGRSVRTVQRWEERFGLPVRHRAGKRTSVFAMEGELNSWLQTRSQFRGPEHDWPTNYAVVFQVAPVALGIFNDSRRWMDANNAMCELLGRSRHQLLRMQLDDVVPQSERHSLLSVWDSMLSRGSVIRDLLLELPADRKWMQFRGIASFVPGLHLVLFGAERSIEDVV